MSKNAELFPSFSPLQSKNITVSKNTKPVGLNSNAASDSTTAVHEKNICCTERHVTLLAYVDHSTHLQRKGHARVVKGDHFS